MKLHKLCEFLHTTSLHATNIHNKRNLWWIHTHPSKYIMELCNLCANVRKFIKIFIEFKPYMEKSVSNKHCVYVLCAVSEKQAKYGSLYSPCTEACNRHRKILSCRHVGERESLHYQLWGKLAWLVMLREMGYWKVCA